jgi:hypothetical protein
MEGGKEKEPGLNQQVQWTRDCEETALFRATTVRKVSEKMAFFAMSAAS